MVKNLLLNAIMQGLNLITRVKMGLKWLFVGVLETAFKRLYISILKASSLSKILSILGVFVILLPHLANASNLGELIDLSLKNEEYLMREFSALKAQSERKSVSRAYLPELSLKGGYLNNSFDKFITSPQNSLFAKLSLTLLIYDGGSREANLRALERGEKLASLAKEQSKNYLALSAATLYFNYQSLQSLIKASEQKELFLKNTLTRLEEFYKAGLAAKDALESVRAKYHLTSLELHKNRLKLMEVEKGLKELSQRDFAPQGEAKLKDIGYESGKSLEIDIAKEQANIAKSKLSTAKSAYLPKIYLQDNFGFYRNNYGINLPPQLNAMGLNLDEYFKKNAKNNEFFIGFEWKIFDFFSTSAKVEKERLEYQIAALNANYVERKNRLETEFLQKELKVLNEQIEALTLANEAASLAFESVDKKYVAGLNSYNDYLQALESKFKAQSDLELARNEFEIAKARYYFISGLDIKERIEQ